MLNEFAIHNILVDVDFLEDEFKQAGRPQLMSAFAELRAVRPSSRAPRPADTLWSAQVASIVLNSEPETIISNSSVVAIPELKSP